MLKTFDIASLTAHRRVFFVVRSDFAVKPGGDIDLARQLSAAATAHGIDARVVSCDTLTDVGDQDALFLFNIDRIYDAVRAMAKASPATHVFLYPLHHPHAGVRRYLKHGVSGARRVLGVLAGGVPDHYEALLDFAKGLRRLDIVRVDVGLRRRRHITTLLRRAKLLVVAEAELAAIELAYGPARNGAELFPHPVADHAPRIAQDRIRYILMPGRIEPRKNQLSALKGLVAAGTRSRDLEIVVVGGKGSDEGYFREVVDFCLANDILYLSQLPKALFFPLVSSASIVVNASYFEVTSLIDLYAIRYGIPLISTRYAYYDPSTTLVQLDPETWTDDPASIGAVIDALLAQPPTD